MRGCGLAVAWTLLERYATAAGRVTVQMAEHHHTYSFTLSDTRKRGASNTRAVAPSQRYRRTGGFGLAPRTPAMGTKKVRVERGLATPLTKREGASVVEGPHCV